MIKQIIGLCIYPFSKNKPSSIDYEKRITNTNINVKNLHISNFIRFGAQRAYIAGDSSLDKFELNNHVLTLKSNEEFLNIKRYDLECENLKTKYMDWYQSLDNMMCVLEALVKDSGNSLEPSDVNVIVSYLDNILIRNRSSSSAINTIQKNIETIDNAAIIFGKNNGGSIIPAYFIFNLEWYIKHVHIYHSSFKHSRHNPAKTYKYNLDILQDIIRTNISHGDWKKSSYEINSMRAKSHLNFTKTCLIHTELEKANVYTVDQVSYWNIESNLLKDIYKSSILEIALAELDPGKKNILVDAVNSFIEDEKERVWEEYMENSLLYKALTEFIQTN